MPSCIQLLTVLCFLADAARQPEHSEVEATVDAEGDSTVNPFQTAWRKRVELDGRDKFTDPKDEMIISRYDEYLSRTSDARLSPHDSVGSFCRGRKKGLAIAIPDSVGECSDVQWGDH